MNEFEAIQERLQRLPTEAQREVLGVIEEIERRYRTTESGESNDEYDHEIVKPVPKFIPYFLKLVDNKDDIEDLMGDVCSKLLQYTSTHPNWQDEIENLDAYIKQTAHRVVYSNWRKYKPSLHDSINDDEHPRELTDERTGIEETENKLIHEKQKQLLHSILKDFPEDKRNLIFMNKVMGYTTKEIGEKLGIDYRIVQHDINLAWTKLKYHAKKVVKKAEVLAVLT